MKELFPLLAVDVVKLLLLIGVKHLLENRFDILSRTSWKGPHGNDGSGGVLEDLPAQRAPKTERAFGQKSPDLIGGASRGSYLQRVHEPAPCVLAYLS